MIMRSLVLLAALTLNSAAHAAPHPEAAGGPASADAVVATLYAADAVGERASLGTIGFRDSPYGLIVAPRLAGLAAGAHAAHIHEKASCSSSAPGAGEQVAAGGAGNHYDPDGAKVHAGPYGGGHRGDLPNLIVEADGSATIPVLAPRLRAAELSGRAIIVHAGPDRYQDHAAHHQGSGGARVYCGLIRGSR